MRKRTLFSSLILLFLALIGTSGFFGVSADARTPIHATLAAFRDLSLQHAIQERMARRIAEHVPISRLYNQMLWNVLGASPTTERFVIGRQSQIYSGYAVREYCVAPHSPESNQAKVELLAQRLSALSHRIELQRHALIVVTTPSKPGIIPQDIPRLLCRGEAANRTTGRLVAALLAAGVPVVDGISLTKKLSASTELPLFPRFGFHWNDFGVHPTVSELLQLAAARLGDERPMLRIAELARRDEPLGATEERADLFNLYWTPREQAVPEPRFTLEPQGGSQRRMTIVGTSFSHAIIRVLESTNAYASIDEFYYLTHYHVRHPGGSRHYDLGLNDIDWANEVFGSDVLVLEMNEQNAFPVHVERFVEEAMRRYPAMPVGS